MGVNELASDSVERDSKGATAPLAGAGQSPVKVKKSEISSSQVDFFAVICYN